jgi:hypothetical protein
MESNSVQYGGRVPQLHWINSLNSTVNLKVNKPGKSKMFITHIRKGKHRANFSLTLSEILRFTEKCFGHKTYVLLIFPMFLRNNACYNKYLVELRSAFMQTLCRVLYKIFFTFARTEPDGQIFVNTPKWSSTRIISRYLELLHSYGNMEGFILITDP